MKIVLPLSDPGNLAMDFAHASFIGFYDDTDGNLEITPLQEIKTLLKGQSFHEYLLSRDLGAMISPQFNFLTLRILKENQVLAFQAVSESLEDNLLAWSRFELKPFQSVYTTGCGSACNSCSTQCS